jgi:hypothetical protein
MKLFNQLVKSGEFFPFEFNGLTTEFSYYASWFEQTGMVVIFKIDESMMEVCREIVTIDRWMTANQFEEKWKSGYIKVDIVGLGIINEIKNTLFHSVLKSYADRYPIAQC